MRRLTVGVLVFFCLVYSEASAQDIPDEARRAISHSLQGPFIVFRDTVQEELKVTDEQKEKLDEHLRELLPEAAQLFHSLEDLKGEEREKKLQAFRKEAQKKLADVLKKAIKEDQLKRLHQLALQQEGALALWHGDPELGKELNITDEQRMQFMAIVKDLQKQISPLIKEAESGGNPEEIRPKVMKIRKESEGKIEALLTDDQKKHWKEMLGKPFVFED